MNQYTVTVDGRDYDVDAPDEGTAWTWANQFHGQRTKRMAEATAADQAANAEAFKRSEADRPLLERALTNVGAGMDTAWQGAKQLFGGGSSDEELADQRRMKAQLAEGTTGGGLLQLAGEVAPTLALPGGAAVGGLTKAGRVGKVLGKALGGPRTLRSAAADAAIGGGLAGALQPVLTDESRLANVGLGVAGGAAGGAAGAGLAKALPLATAAGRENRRLARGGKELLERLDADQPGRAAAAAKAIEDFQRGRNTYGVTGEVPLTTPQTLRMAEGDAAGSLGSTRMAATEMGVRPAMADEFGQLAQRQNEALYGATQKAGMEGTEDMLQRVTAAREEQTAPLREAALAAAGRWPEVGAPLQEMTAAIRARSAAGTPARGLADLAERTLSENPTPVQLYDLRKLIANKLSGPHLPGDDVAAVVKGAEREAMQLMKAIDARLDEAAARKGTSPTQFSDYLERYSQQSKPVSSVRAQQQINEALAAEGRPLVGNAPETTRHVLSKAVQRFGQNKRGQQRLDPNAMSRYNDLLGFMQKMEEPTRSVKLGGTGGGGSQTATQLGLGERVGQRAMQAGAEMAVPGGGFAVGAATQAGREALKREVAGLMLDPGRAAQAIRAKLAQGEPLTRAEEQFLQLSRGAGAGLPLAMSQQQATQ